MNIFKFNENKLNILISRAQHTRLYGSHKHIPKQTHNYLYQCNSHYEMKRTHTLQPSFNLNKLFHLYNLENALSRELVCWQARTHIRTHSVHASTQADTRLRQVKCKILNLVRTLQTKTFNYVKRIRYNRICQQDLYISVGIAWAK